MWRTWVVSLLLVFACVGEEVSSTGQRMDEGENGPGPCEGSGTTACPPGSPFYCALIEHWMESVCQPPSPFPNGDPWPKYGSSGEAAAAASACIEKVQKGELDLNCIPDWGQCWGVPGGTLDLQLCTDASNGVAPFWCPGVGQWPGEITGLPPWGSPGTLDWLNCRELSLQEQLSWWLRYRRGRPIPSCVISGECLPKCGQDGYRC